MASKLMNTTIKYACLMCFISASVSFLPIEITSSKEIIAQRTAAQLYRQCVSCHGSDGRAKTNKGKYSHARDLTDPKWQDDVTDERIFNSIMNGRDVRGTMPAFSKKFSEAEVNSLVKFVRGLRK
jgi:mono/diheme cytochrome c family protein